MNKKHHLCEIVDADKCKGCTNCVRNCPTEAIRVRKGTAVTITEHCINCGNCIRTCPYHAKMAITDPLDLNRLKEFKYNIALASPVLYAQFHRPLPPGKVLNALKSLGFDDVFQESVGADCVALSVKEHLKKPDIKKPVISSACPAVIRLIQIRFPGLVGHIAPFLPPVEIAAKLARKQASKTKNIPEDQIGVFLITPCTAKANYIRHPLGLEKSHLDGAISLIHLYGNIMNALLSAEDEFELARSSGPAVGWARSGGETMAINTNSYLVADGLSNVINILQEVELGRFDDVDYLECQVCHSGCVGGPLTVENPFKARIIIRNLVSRLPLAMSRDCSARIISRYRTGFFNIERPIEARPVMPMDQDISKAIRLVSRSEEILHDLPGLDCCSCGSPSCRALAEDIARGYASITDCIFVLLESFQHSAQDMLNLINRVQTMDKTRRGKEN